MDDIVLDGWSLLWGDEFDGPPGAPPDPAVWGHEVGGRGWGNDELQCYTDSTDNASLDGNGNLAVMVRRVHPGPATDGCSYTSARLITKDRVAFTHVLVSARIRLPRGTGLWPAFWMLGQDIDDNPWPRCGEIDVMENFGVDPTSVSGTVHGPGFAGHQGVGFAHAAGTDLTDDFHDYAVHWDTDRVHWYLDGARIGTVTRADLPGRQWPFDHDFYLLLNVAVGGDHSVPPDDSLDFPQSMLVDHVRVYTREDSDAIS